LTHAKNLQFFAVEKLSVFQTWKNSKNFSGHKTSGFVGIENRRFSNVVKIYDFGTSKNEVIENALHFQSPKNRRFFEFLHASCLRVSI